MVIVGFVVDRHVLCLCVTVNVVQCSLSGLFEAQGLQWAIPPDSVGAVTIGDSYRLQLSEVYLVDCRLSGWWHSFIVTTKHDTTGGFWSVCALGLMRPHGVLM